MKKTWTHERSVPAFDTGTPERRDIASKAGITWTAMILNFIIAGITAMASIMMLTGIGEGDALADTGLEMLKYFTVDSNLLMGIVALIAAIAQAGIIRGKKEKLSRRMEILLLTGTTAVSLTLIVVVVFLSSIFPGGFAAMIEGANLYFHLITPLLAILVLVVFERNRDINFPRMLYAMLPTVIYATIYTANALTHAVDGQVSAEYDWYRFVAGGTQYAPTAICTIIAGTFVISLLLWLGSRRTPERRAPAFDAGTPERRAPAFDAGTPEQRADASKIRRKT